VRLLEDRNGDGKYETAKVFADKLVYPMGLAWRAGKLYIADPPELITFEDTDNDGRADNRSVILSKFGARDNGSLHGLTFGPDGLLYMTTGEPDGYRFELADDKVLEGNSGALIRCRPDGSNPEVLARGFENLVEVIFMPGGEIIGTDNWYQRPQGGIRDALLHLVDGGLYPMHPDTGTPYPVTGDKLPPLALFPAVALSGLVRYDGGAFPSEFQGNLFSAQHNARRIGRHILRRGGSTFVSDDSDFLTTDDPDFHPSDVLQDKDGSLLVLDTGSWYTQHCPTGRIRKSPATGGIYRVRYTGQKGEKPKPDAAAPIWAMASGAIDRNRLRSALFSTNTDVACVAARVIGLRRLREFMPELAKLVIPSNPPVQLAAAEALARCGDASAIPTLVTALYGPADRFLEHALIHALHYIADERSLVQLLDDKNPRAQKAALLLLSQPPRPRDALKPDMVLARVRAPDVELRRTALQLLKLRPAWSSQAVRVAKDWLAAERLSEDQSIGLRELCGAFFEADPFQESLRSALSTGSPEARNLVLEIASRQPPPQNSAAWIPALRTTLADPASHTRTLAARVAVGWRLDALSGTLRELAGDGSQNAGVRKECLRSVIVTYTPLPQSIFEFLIGELRGPDPLTVGELLRKARLTDEQLITALGATRNSILLPPAALLGPFASTSLERSHELLDGVAKLPPTGWDEKRYDEFVKSLPAQLQTSADALRKHFQPERESQQERMAKFEPLLIGGDAERGRTVFTSSKVACATCHAIGNQGGRIGPDLTRVGAIRSGGDILESILFPSSTFAQGYEPFAVETKDGEEYSGILAEQNEQHVVLRTMAGAEINISRSNLKGLRRNSLSIMPEGLDTAMSEQEFRDLLAFLQSLK
jgi:putative membrane-bound dehydrogenase-like protein